LVNIWRGPGFLQAQTETGAFSNIRKRAGAKNPSFETMILVLEIAL
jgi:hypothetical protein